MELRVHLCIGAKLNPLVPYKLGKKTPRYVSGSVFPQIATLNNKIAFQNRLTWRGCYSGIFYSCQFIKSFRSLHSFWEEEDLSREINTSFTEWHHYHYHSYSVSESSSQGAVVYFKNFCLFSSFLFHYKTFTRYLIIKYLINVKPITSSHKIQTKIFTWPNMSFYAR